MKIVRFRHGDFVRYGFLEGDLIVEAEGDLFDGLKPTSRSTPRAKALVLAPVNPPNIFCLGLNYRQHAAETGIEPPDQPRLFLKTTTTIVD